MNNWDQKLQVILEEYNIAGMSVAVTDKKNIIYSKGFGVNSIENKGSTASDKSMYRIASITKIITGLTILKLVENGVLDLDKPVNEYVQWLKLSNEQSEEYITLRHLLSHASGLPTEYTPIGPKDEAALEESLKNELPVAKITSLPDEGKFLYSNLGIRLASYIAQLAGEKPFSELAMEMIIKPLKMENTTFELCVAATYPLSLPHIIDEDGKLSVEHCIKENAARLGAGGLYSNVIDLCKLARFLLNKGNTDEGIRILSDTTIDEMFKKHVNCANNGWYGLAMMGRNINDDTPLVGHLGDNSPYVGSLWIEKNSGYGVVAELNTGVKELRNLIPDIIFNDLLK